MAISMQVLHSCQNCHFDFLLYRVRATVVVKAKCEPLNLQPQAKKVTKRKKMNPNRNDTDLCHSQNYKEYKGTVIIITVI